MIYGITGRIGCGKSYVCELMRKKHNAIIFDCDLEAKKILHCPRIKEKVCTVISPNCYNGEGKYRPKFISKMIRENKFILRVLEHIVQPEILKLFKAGCESIQKYRPDANIIMETAILFDIGWDKHVDKTIWVKAPFDVRKRRVMRRLSYELDDKSVQEYMLLFPQGNAYMTQADYIIQNDGIKPIDLSFMASHSKIWGF